MLALHHAAGFAGLALAYWLLDLALRRRWLVRLAGLDDRPRAALALWGAIAVVVGASVGWRDGPHPDVARLLAMGLAGFLAWKVATKDIDIVTGEAHGPARIGLLAAAGAAWFGPAGPLLALALLTRPFAQWRHHAILPMRVLMVVAAYGLAAPLLAAVDAAVGPPPVRLDGATLVLFVAVMHASHYFSTGVAKARLGPRWWSWVADNRLHDLVAAAWGWGWARRLPWSAWSRVVGGIRAVERPAQAFVFAVEIGAPLALVSREAAWIFCGLWSLFHIGVVLTAGFWFYDWVWANLLLAAALWLLPAAAVDAVFGWQAVVAGLLFVLAFPMRNRLWGPTALGWWETPLIQRTHWIVEGESGRRYQLYADFMCPHERLYAKVHGCFMAPVPVVTFHAGVVWSAAHRDAVQAAGPDRDGLDALAARWGVDVRDADRTRQHLAYLQRFLQAINRGARKHVLPRGLRWLKSPGGHLYYGGDDPPFRGQEKAVRCTLEFREHYFDGDRLVPVGVHNLATVDVDGDAPPCGPEPTARAMERYLMRALYNTHRERGLLTDA